MGVHSGILQISGCPIRQKGGSVLIPDNDLPEYETSGVVEDFNKNAGFPLQEDRRTKGF